MFRETCFYNGVWWYRTIPDGNWYYDETQLGGSEWEYE